MRIVFLLFCTLIVGASCGRKASVQTVPGTIIGDETSFFYVEGAEDDQDIEFDDYFADDDEDDE